MEAEKEAGVRVGGTRKSDKTIRNEPNETRVCRIFRGKKNNNTTQSVGSSPRQQRQRKPAWAQSGVVVIAVVREHNQQLPWRLAFEKKKRSIALGISTQGFPLGCGWREIQGGSSVEMGDAGKTLARLFVENIISE